MPVNRLVQQSLIILLIYRIVKIVDIDIDNTPSPEALVLEFKARGLQKGDRLLLISSKIDDTQILRIAIFFITLVAIMRVFKETVDVVSNMNTSIDIQKKIKKIYDIELSIDIREVDESLRWQQFSQSKLLKAYSDAEPEYTESMVKEPNPDYKK